MYQDTVTVFNRCGDMWYPTVLHGVDLNVDKAAIFSRYGAQSKVKAILHIKSDRQFLFVGDSGKVYLTPKQWRQTDAKTVSITFADGEKFDFFMEGEWPDEEPVNDDSYATGFYDHMDRTRDGVYAINSVSRFSVIPHFEITGG